MNANDDKRIAEIRERCDKATAGPWFWNQYRATLGQQDPRKETDIKAKRVGIVQWLHLEDDMRFCAAARSDIPYLLEKITALESQLAQRPVVANSATTAEMPTPRTDAMAFDVTDEGNIRQRKEGIYCDSDEVRQLEREITALEAKLAEAEKWKDEDPRMLREQCRVADVAFNALNERHNVAQSELSTLRRQVEEVKRAHAGWKQSYEREIEECDKQIAHCKIEKDDYGINFYQGKRSGLINHDIALTQLDTALQQLAQRGEGK